MCGSSRRRPITSPPGGGTLARPCLASNGPASRNDARIRLASNGSSSSDDSSVACTRTSCSPVHSTSAPSCAISAIIVSTSRMRGTLCSTTGSLVSRHAARIGRAPFLLPVVWTRPLSGRPPWITKDSASESLTSVWAIRGGYPSAALEPTRERAWETLTRYTKSEALLRHALAVEAAVGAYAIRFGENEQLWRATALLHDFDYEMHPTLDEHPQDGAPILRGEGWPEEVVEGVLSHASHLGLPRDTPLKKTLFACDELCGFIHACGLVRPEGIDTLEPKSVRKKLKQPSFAAGGNRDDVYEGAEPLGVDLDEHIAFMIAAMRPIAADLGLRSSESAQQTG